MNTVKRMCVDIRKYWNYAVYSARADLKSEVANSYLNWIWWVLEPFCLMLVYAFIFGTIFKASEQYFTIFIFIGLTMWDFFSRGVTNSVRNIKNNKSIISRIYIPKYILFIAKMMVHAFKMFISCALIVLMMFIYRVPISWYLLYVPVLLVLLFLFTFAIGIHLLHFGVFVMDMGNIVNIAMKLVFYMSGIFYHIPTRLPGPLGEILMNFNPMAMLLTGMRNVVLYQKQPPLMQMLIVFIVSIILAIWGVKRVYKYENSYAKIV